MFIGLLALVNLIACKKDDLDPPGEDPTAVIVKFGNDVSVAENAGPQEIAIHFNKAAQQAGNIEVKVNSDANAGFQTNPATVMGVITIPVVKNDTSATFTLTPVNNNLLDGERQISFEITEVSEGFEIGTQKNTLITILDDESVVAANFFAESGVLYENTPEGFEIKVLFTAAATHDGKVRLRLDEMPENPTFTTQPALSANGEVELTVSAGAIVASLRVIPTDNALLKGHQSLAFSIIDAEGGIIKGEGLSFVLNLLDDELAGKPRFYETVAGNWRNKKTYHYDENGRIASIAWETATPNTRTGTDTYYYAANGLLERVNHSGNEDEYFYQENGRIVRSETIEDGVKTEYSDYDYDAAGNAAGRSQYYRQDNGAYVLSFIFVFLYQTDGNLYKQLSYIPGEDPANPILVSTRSFETYTTSANPFYTIEVIPGVKTQHLLPASYRLQENNVDLLYHFTYQFREDGLLEKRTTTGAASEVTTYGYY